MYEYIPAITPDEIYHHGILGQKWGKRNGPPYPLGAGDHSYLERKYARQSNKVHQLQRKRSDLKNRKGLTSRAYMKTSKNLYLAREKSKLTKSKIDKDDVAKALAKTEIKEAKTAKSKGMTGWFSQDYRKVFGNKLSSKEIEALMLTEHKRNRVKNKVRPYIKPAITLSTIAAISIGAKWFNANSQKITFDLARKGKEKYIYEIVK